MTMQTEFKVLSRLRSLEIFADLETEHLKKLAAAASEVEFHENDIIYDEGHVGHGVYIIDSGQVAIEMKSFNEDYVTLHRLGPGEVFGWSALFPAERKGARARVLKPTQAIMLDANQLRAAWQHDHRFENAIIHRTTWVMLDRIRQARRQLVDALADKGTT